ALRLRARARRRPPAATRLFLRDGGALLVGHCAWPVRPRRPGSGRVVRLRDRGSRRRARRAADVFAARLVCAVSRASFRRADTARGPAARRASDVGARRPRFRRRRSDAVRGVAPRVGPPHAVQVMKTTPLRIVVGCLALVAAGAAGCRRGQNVPGGGPAAPQGAVPGSPPATRLVSAVPDGEWRMPAGDYSNLRYSTLDTIRTTNVMHLQVVTTFSTGIPHGHEG